MIKAKLTKPNPKLTKRLFFTLLLLTSLFALPNIHVLAQETDFRTSFTDAEYYFLFNDFREALPLYLKALDEQPNNSNLGYRIGLCYLNIPGYKHNAITYLEDAIKNINASYQEGSYKETGAPINAYFYLGEAYRIAERLDDAIEAYKTFRGKLDTKDVYNLDFVNQQIAACQRAKEKLASPLNVEFEQINLFDSEKYIHNASVSYDGNNLLFTVRERFYDAIYVCTKDENEEWGTPINITLDLVVEGELYTTSINYDGTQIFIFRSERGIGNIYTSKKVDGIWQKVQKLGRKINTRNWETSASISPDGETLFFSSNRRGGAGGLDLYYSQMQPNGDWGDAVSLGSTINTPHNEESPYLSPDGNTLYFISQGHNSIGGYDIFYSKRLSENEWSTPINMGYPINTTDDDMYYFPLESNKGILSRVEKDNPNVRKLYVVSTVSVSQVAEVNITGKLSLANSFEVQSEQFNVSLFDVETNEKIKELNPEDLTGEFTMTILPGSYRIVAMGEGYTPKTLTIAIPEDYNQPDYAVYLELTPEQVTSGEYLAIRSILYDFDSDLLTRDAVFELEKLYNILKKYPDVSIEVSGHTDNKGSAKYNFKLSLKRAQSVINYLTDKGIDNKRLIARGAGSFENIATNYTEDGLDNPEGRSLNRRASIKILQTDSGIKISEQIDIPEHLKPRDQNYTILLAPINYEVKKNELNKISASLGIDNELLKGFKDQFAYVIGSFQHKSEAIELLNYTIDNGFPLSTIIGEDDLNNLISRPLSVTKQSLIEDDKIYTIQLMALIEPAADKSIFKNLDVKEIKGNDGMFRYIYGEYLGKNAALEDLEEIKAKGFSEAFVMNINRYK